MAITKYRPATLPASPFSDIVNEFFGRDLSQFFGHDDIKRAMPSVNITEHGNGFRLELLAPGYGKEDLKIAVEQDVLTISAEHKQEQLQEDERYTRREFSRSSFSRSFKLPEGVDATRIKAGHQNGVLQVEIPKAEKAKPKVHTIDIA